MALGVRQQVKIWKTGHLPRHYIAEISLNVTLNHNQLTNPMYKYILTLFIIFLLCSFISQNRMVKAISFLQIQQDYL